MSEELRAVMACDEAVRRLWDYLDHAGESPDHARVEEHLTFCRQCCGELEFIKHLRGVLAAQAADELPPPVVERLERFVEEL
jgi:predicted anti-sigma-YlaC factor YlaD